MGLRVTQQSVEILVRIGAIPGLFVDIKSALSLAQFGTSYEDWSPTVGTTLGLNQGVVPTAEQPVEISTTLNLNDSLDDRTDVIDLSSVLILQQSLGAEEHVDLVSTISFAQGVYYDDPEQLIISLSLLQGLDSIIEARQVGINQQLPLIRRVMLRSGEPFHLNGAQIIGLERLDPNYTRITMTNTTQYVVLGDPNQIATLFNGLP
jgi:hypothetical protein